MSNSQLCKTLPLLTRDEIELVTEFIHNLYQYISGKSVSDKEREQLAAEYAGVHPLLSKCDIDPLKILTEIIPELPVAEAFSSKLRSACPINDYDVIPTPEVFGKAIKKFSSVTMKQDSPTITYGDIRAQLVEGNEARAKINANPLILRFNNIWVTREYSLMLESMLEFALGPQNDDRMFYWQSQITAALHQIIAANVIKQVSADDVRQYKAEFEQWLKEEGRLRGQEKLTTLEEANNRLDTMLSTLSLGEAVRQHILREINTYISKIQSGRLYT